MIWISNLAMAPTFIMDVQQIFLGSFGILEAVVEALRAILIYVRWIDNVIFVWVIHYDWRIFSDDILD